MAESTVPAQRWSVLSIQNLRQANTKKAIAGFSLAGVLFFFPPSNPLSPDQVQALAAQFKMLVDQVDGIIVIGCAFVAALSKILATFHSITAMINLFHNEDKHATLPTQLKP